MPFFCWGGQNWTEQSGAASPRLSRGKDHRLWPAASALNAARVLLAFFTLRAYCSPVVSLLCQNPNILLSKAAFRLLSCQNVLVPELFLPRSNTVQLSILNLMKFAYFSSLFRSIWRALHPHGLSVTPPSFVSSSNFLRVYFDPVSQVIGEKVKLYWLSIEPQDTQVPTCLQLDFKPLLVTLWAQQLSPLSIHVIVHFSNSHFASLSVMTEIEWLHWNQVKEHQLLSSFIYLIVKTIRLDKCVFHS